MKLIQTLGIVGLALMGAACSNFNQLGDLFHTDKSNTVKVDYDSPNRYENTSSTPSKKPVVKSTTKRINTTQCHDSDDWYLDGYRVGRSFSEQKAQMLQQRMSYCQLSQLPTHFKNNWERGYAVGYREATPSRKRK